MRAFIQRVKKASVMVDGMTVGKIKTGLLIFLGIRNGDSMNEAKYMAEKCVNLRIFTDHNGKFNLSALDVGAEILVVSQFTLYGDTRKGRRPSFVDAAPPEISQPLYESFVSFIKDNGIKTASGQFGAHMQVHLVNDGPVTILAEKENEI